MLNTTQHEHHTLDLLLSLGFLRSFDLVELWGMATKIG